MSRTTLLLARHGQTAENANKVFQGQRGHGLDAVGRAQAEKLAERLRGKHVARIVASDLERAAETAHIIGAALGLPVAFDEGLREVDLGAWSGLSHDVVAEKFPGEWAAWCAGDDVRRGGGETYAELAVRIGAAIERVAEHDSQSPVLVVSHGAALRSFVSDLLGLAPQGTSALGAMTNAALTTVVRDANRMRLLSWNDAAHLESD